MLLRLSLSCWMCFCAVASSTDDQPFVVRLHQAIRQLQLEHVQHLVTDKDQTCINQHFNGHTALGVAIGLISVREDHANNTKTKAIIHLLLSAGASPNLETRVGKNDLVSPIMLAALHESLCDVAIQLIEKGADIYATSTSLSHLNTVSLAAYQQNKVLIQFLRERNTTPKEKEKMEWHIKRGEIFFWQNMANRLREYK